MHVGKETGNFKKEQVIESYQREMKRCLLMSAWYGMTARRWLGVMI